MAFRLPDLPFNKAALDPHISSRTLEFHHQKHHAAYVNKLNELIAGTPLEDLSLEAIIQQADKNPQQVAVFNNAAQIAHHTFFWHSLSPSATKAPKEGPFKKLLDASFKDIQSFQEAFRKAAIGQFGSGWVWLTLNQEGKLAIEATSNAQLPEGKPLLTCDVWEHAYYLDYQNRRPDYVTTFLEHLINWSFAEDNLKAA